LAKAAALSGFRHSKVLMFSYAALQGAAPVAPLELDSMLLASRLLYLVGIFERQILCKIPGVCGQVGHAISRIRET
jgi:hypothetical protein